MDDEGNKPVSWNQCFKIRQQYKEDMKVDMKKIDDKMLEVAEDCKSALQEMSGEIKEMRKDVASYVFWIAIALIAFSATVVGAIVAVVYYLIE